MPTLMHSVTIFIGGPRDTTEDRKAVHQHIDTVLARRFKDSLRLEVKYFNHPREPVGVGFGQDWQQRIDKEINPSEMDVGILLFRWKLGEERSYQGKSYPSMSAYELECFLSRSTPDVTVLRYETPFKPSFPDNLDSLSEEEQKAALERNKSNRAEYNRLDAYLRELTVKHSELPVQGYSDQAQLLGYVESYLGDWLARFLERFEKPKEEAAVELGRESIPGWPFRSFASLTDEDHSIFFGRETEVAGILGELNRPEVRFLCIQGMSGTGKSSLLQAGVLPPLLSPAIAAQHGIHYRPGTSRVLFTPGDQPFTSLAYAVAGDNKNPLYRTSATMLAENLEKACGADVSQAKSGVEKWLSRPILEKKPSEAELLIVVDQAEELWTKCSEPARKAFLLLMVAAVETPRLRVLITLRGDLFNTFAEFAPIASILNSSRNCCLYILTPPKEENLARMIEGPIRFAKLERDPRLVWMILVDAQRIGDAALPLIAHALSLLAKEGDGRKLKIESYVAMGGLAGAVQASLERAGSVPEDQLPPLFDLLYEMRNGIPIRRVVSRHELEELKLDVGTAIDRLIDARILLGGGVGPDGKRFDNFQLAHDALFQGWEKLRTWIQEHRRDLELRDELLRDAERWENRGRRTRHLRLRPEALDELLQLDREKPYMFGRHPVIGRYLKAADALRERELLIGYLKGGHIGTAIEAYRKGARLGKEDRGTEPNQLRSAFHAAATGDDRVDEEFFAPATAEASNADGPSIFDDPANVSLVLSRGLEPLDIAALFGHMKLVRKLIARGANPCHLSLNGSTMLHHAAFGGQLEVVRFLVEEIKLDADAIQGDRVTPLLWALNQGHERVAAYLLDHGARMDTTAKEGWNALTETIRGGELQSIKKLVDDLHFDVNYQVGSNFTALCVACQKIEPRYLKIAEFLIERGASPDGGEIGWRPLSVAASVGFGEMLKLLMDRGADPNKTNGGGGTALHAAAGLASAAHVRMLLERDANPNILDDNGDTPLSIAAKAGRDEAIELLLALKADPNLKTGKAWTALQYATDDGDLALTRLLLDAKSDVNDATLTGWSPLHLAAANGHEAIVKLLLECGAICGAREKDGWTPLHLAAANGHEAIVQLLLDRGADVTASNEAQRTSLHMAAVNKHEPIVRLLLDHGADVAVQDKDRWTPLHMAARNGHESIVRLLLDRGADIAAEEKDKRTSLYLAAVGSYEPVVRLLLNRGADVMAREADEWTPLHMASRNGDQSIVRFLLDHGADVAAREKDQWTPLHLAAHNGNEAVVRLLMESGSDVTAREKDRWTPLHMAAANGYEAAVRLLLERGADPTARQKDELTPLHISAHNGHSAVVKLLLENHADPDVSEKGGWTPLHMAAAGGREAVVKLLLEHGANLAVRENEGLTPLHLAARNGYEAIVRLLLDHGGETAPSGGTEWTLLHLAAAGGHEAVVRLLIERGAQVDAREKDGWTPLHMAARNGHEAVVRLLAEQGADVVTREKDGWTPLHMAAAYDRQAVVRLLLNCGASIDAQNGLQQTPFQLAEANGHTGCMRILLEHGATIDEQAASRLATRRTIPEPGQVEEASKVLCVLAQFWGSEADAAAALGWTRTAQELIAKGAAEPQLWKQSHVSDTAWFLTFQDFDPLSNSLLTAARETLAPKLVGAFEESRWRKAELGFFPGYNLISVEDVKTPGQNEQFLIAGPDSVTQLSWENEAIYSMAEQSALDLEDDQVLLSYCRFFFHWVRGGLGRFQIVERGEQIRWSEPVSEEKQAEVAALLRPLVVVERTEDFVRMNSTVVFKNALFTTDILAAVRPTDLNDSETGNVEKFIRGQMKLLNEELLLEEQPFIVDGPAGIFG